VINLGKLGKDAKDLLIGIDGSDKEPNDFKNELQSAIKAGIISKSDGTLLITSRMNADKLGEKIGKDQIKDVSSAKDGREFDTPEEEREYLQKKEEELKRRKEREAEVARQAQTKSINTKKVENVKEQKTTQTKERNEE
jgi:hypothetical protein